MWKSNFLAKPLYFINTSNDIIIVKVLTENKITNLEEYGEWLFNNIKYKKDIYGLYSWASPEETLNKGYGDCEDFAFLTKEVLQMLGYKVYVIVMFAKDYGHAFCLVEYNNQWTIFDNNTFIHTKITDGNELLTFLKKNYKFILMKEIKL